MGTSLLGLQRAKRVLFCELNIELNIVHNAVLFKTPDEQKLVLFVYT